MVMRLSRASLFLIFVSLLFACRQTPLVKKENLAVLPEGEKRPVEVVLASPQGETQGPDDYQALTLVFNQPMRPLTGIDEEAPQDLLSVTPAVAGKSYWKGTATLEFRPDEPLPRGNSYQVRLKEGLSSWAGTQLEKPFEFKFTTPGPKLVKTEPSNKKRHVDPENSIALQFDQPLNGEKVQDFVILYTTDAKTGKIKKLSWQPVEADAEVKKRLEAEEEVPAEHLLVIKSPDLQPGTEYFVKVKQGLLGVAGEVGSSKTELFSFQTFEKFVWAESQAGGTFKVAPEEPLEFMFSNPVVIADVVKNLTIEPELKIPEHYLESDYDSTHVYLYLDFKPQTTYKVTLGADLQDRFGHKLGKAGSFTLKTGDLRGRFQAPEGMGVLEAKGPKQLPLGVRNLEKVTTRTAVLDRDDLIRMMNTDGHFWGKGFKPESPMKKSDLNVAKLTRNELHERPLELGKTVKTGFGYIYYELRGHRKGDDSGWVRRGLAQVTNLGLTAKFSPENTLVMVSKLDQGTPLEGAVVDITDPKGTVLWSGKTGKDGTVDAPGWKALGRSSNWGVPSMIVFARQGKDEAFTRSSGFGGLSPWMFEVPFTYTPKKIDFRGYGFSERGLYRPGETAMLKGALRQKKEGQWVLPDLDGVRYQIKDARDQKIDEGLLEVSAFGSFSHEIRLSKQAPTGSYRVSYSLPERVAKQAGGAELFSTGFRVEAFRPAQFEVTMEGPKDPLVAGDKANFSSKGWWLFGAPMKGEDVSWTARLEPYRSSVKDFESFDFGPMFEEEDHRDESTDLASDKGQLDDKGLKAIEVETKGMTFKGDGLLVVESTVTSPTRQELSGRTQIPVYRGEFRIGLKPTSTFVPSAQPVAIQTVAITPKDDTIQGQEIKLELYRREWNSVRKVDVDGSYRWVSQPKDELVGEETVRSGVKPVDVPMTPPKPGFYVIKAVARDGRGNDILTSSYLYAYGGGYVAWLRSDDEKVELVADKQSYAPGETAKILVKSPYEKATALVTLERELIMERFVTQIEGSADTLEIPLKSEHLPNVYVSVVLLQGRDAKAGFDPNGEDLGKPSFKIGYVDLPVTPKEKKLQVAVTSDKDTYGPGDEVTLTLETKDAADQPVEAEVTVMVADKAVLNLINYATPDYFETFYRPRSLSVWTSENRLDVIGQRSYGTKGEDSGGGGGLSSDYRKDFKFTAFWEPSVVTSTEGKAELKFKLPENLSTFRVMAVGHTKSSQFGSGDTEIVVNKPLILKPSLPTFIRVGDELQAGVLAFNNSEGSIGMTLQVELEGLEAKAHVESVVAIEAGEEKEILFPVVAGKPGEAVFRFKAIVSGAQSDGLEMRVPIILPTATETVATSGKVTGEQGQEGIEVPQTSIAGTAKLLVSVSASALSGLEQTILTMMEYPHGCLEQRLSRMAPLLLAEDLLTSMEIEGFSREEIRGKVQEGWKNFSDFQRGDGGFGVWPDSRYSNPYLTSQLLMVAHQARKAGYDIDKKMEKRARNYLSNYLKGKASLPYSYGEKQDLVIQAAAVNARALGGAHDPARLARLFGQREKMATVGKVYLLDAAITMNQQRIKKILTQELTNAIKVEAQTAHFEVDDHLPWIYSSSLRDTGLILDVLLRAEPEFAVADRVVKWLMERRKSDGAWGSTQENHVVLKALSTYLKASEPQKPDFKATVGWDAEELIAAAFEAQAAKPVSHETTLEPGAKKTLNFSKKGEGTLFYNVRMSYAPGDPKPPRDRGLAVFKQYFEVDSSGPVSEMSAGKTYKVKLSLVSPTDRYFVMMEDAVPAGVEVVQTTFATESQALARVLKNGGRHGGTFDHTETYDDRMLLFSDFLSAGEHHFEYLVRARLPGTYQLPATRAEEMYHPEIFGTGPSRKIVVR